MFRYFFLVFLTLSFFGCHSEQKAPERISVMSFNVENLFDTKHDPGKNDHTYLPLAVKQTAAHRSVCAAITRESWRRQCLELDWSEAVLRKKLSKIAATILQVNKGVGPDIVLLQEVENKEVLERLRTEFLSAANYQPAILLEGPDARGIDCAILTRFELKGEAKIHAIPFSEPNHKSRPILEATVNLPSGEPLVLYSVHFPAPYHPVKLRREAQLFLNQLADGHAGAMQLAAGDFNLPSDRAKDMEVFHRYAKKKWVLSHELGCGDCRGTVYYRPTDTWSFFDTVLASKNLGFGKTNASGWVIDPSSIRIANEAPEQKTAKGTPNRFHFKKHTGVSDHWPFVIELKRRELAFSQ